MSSPTPFPSFTIPPASSPTATQSSGGSTNNGTLYLYTFLATLVLLLAVSSAIVIRSLILRRRHQRLVEEAIRTGSWLPGGLDSVMGRRRRDLNEKPKLWEVWLHPDDDHESDHGEHENAKAKWGDIMPVYATYVNDPTLSPQAPVTSPAENSVDRSPYPSRFLRPFTRRRSPPSPQPTSPVASQECLPASSPITSTSAVRVAVLIAMPSQPQRHGSDENGPPVVELGVAETDVKSDEIERASPSRGDS